MRSLMILVVSGTLFASLVATAGLQRATPAVDFERDVKPILQKSCLKCHGAAQQQGGLRLDSADFALKLLPSGRRAIVSHDATHSELIKRISDPKDDQRMPPAYSGLGRLTPAEINVLKAWIDAGPSFGKSVAVASDAGTHWSLKPLRRPALPVKTANPIDAFIVHALAKKGLTFSPVADRKTLLRRVTYDLTGLPPTSGELKNFVSDTKPGAYERVVDRLLASPRYGERWARHWLDTIHFADSHGFEHDIGRDNAWPFRDYVIESFNQDKHWDRFIREQLAADYFFPDEPSLTPALGFLGAGTFDLSAYTTAPKNFELLDKDDMVTQTMTAFDSVTANCARCHAHKFDPIPQADYYALQAVFGGITKGDITYDASKSAAAERARLTAAIAAANKMDKSILLAPETKLAVDRWTETLRNRRPWVPAKVEKFASAEGSTLTENADGSISSGGKRPETDSYTTTLVSTTKLVTGLRLDVLASKDLPMGGPGRNDNGNLHLSEIDVSCVDSAGVAKPIKIAKATADFNQEGWGVERAIDGDKKTAWGIYPQVGKPHNALFAFADPVKVDAASRIVVTLRQLHGGGHLIGRYRLSLTDADPKDLTALPLPVEEALAVPTERRTPDQQLTIAAHVVREEANTALAKLPAQQKVFAAAKTADVLTVGPITIAQPPVMYRLERGDLSQPKEVVEPGALTALATLEPRFKLPDAKNEATRRAALAEWIASPKNVLTWRSIVNRVWHYHFGRGICDTPSDLGKMGGKPSHPELIDWLAVWFRDDAKGSLKALHRLIVTSATYKQCSAIQPHAAKIDGDNRLLWRQNRLRLDADSYRDFVRAASGKLDLTMGGPAIKNFTMKPGPQLTPALNYSEYDWKSPGANRRSIYRNVWRGIADPFMDALDFPDLGLLAPVRGNSVSSLQALSLFNNPFVLYFSGELASMLVKEKSPPEAQVDAAVNAVWLRNPSPAERKSFVEYAAKHGLPALCRVLFNSDEFFFVD
ncbi:MAG: PSD1 and planctomycete cytochrome C domain-containing protein [Chthonomonadales bacterium]